MQIGGSYEVRASRDVVWARLMDPETLSRALPGCGKFEPDGSGGFNVVMKVGIAAIKGVYQGRVKIADPIPPQSYRMTIEGKGSGGFLKGDGTLTLSDSPGGTTIEYSGEAQVGGPIAGIGQRLIQAAARQIANQFFESLAKQVSQSQ
ncbi:MAG: SRPBCC family protein [Terriglobia bacterium]